MAAFKLIQACYFLIFLLIPTVMCTYHLDYDADYTDFDKDRLNSCHDHVYASLPNCTSITDGEKHDLLTLYDTQTIHHGRFGFNGTGWNISQLGGGDATDKTKIWLNLDRLYPLGGHEFTKFLALEMTRLAGYSMPDERGSNHTAAWNSSAPARARGCIDQLP